jgi:drug/metabolite transporter (DMT)-like permease
MTVLAPFDYVCLVWVILFDYIVFKTPLTISGFCGMLMIVIGGLVSLNADKENFKS